MPPHQNRLCAGIDIGTSKIAVAVCENKEGLINIAALGVAPSHGLRKGIIVDPEEVVTSLSQAIEDAEKMAGQQITDAVIGVGGVGIVTSISKGIIPVASPEGITEEDVQRVIDSARSVALPPNFEIIHIYPIKFVIDRQEEVKDPIGMKGMRLEVEVMAVGAPTANVRKISQIISQLGINPLAMVVNPIAASKAVLDKKQKEIGVMLLDIGAATSSIAIFEESDLIHTNILPIGSTHLTNDIAIGLKTTIEIAEKIKRQHLSLDKKIKATDKLDLSAIESGEEGKVSKKQLADVAEARLKELFSMIKDEIKKHKPDALLPGGIVLTGGGSKMDGLVAIVKEYMNLPAKDGDLTMDIGGTIDKLGDPRYSTSIGLALYGLEIPTQEGSSGKFSVGIKNNSIGGLWSKVRKVFKQFSP